MIGASQIEVTETRPQSERAALEARAAIQWKLAKICVKASLLIGRNPVTEANQIDWKRRRGFAREYLRLWKKTRDLIRSLPE